MTLKLLMLLNYDVKDKNGKTNYKSNIFDIALFSAYTTISVFNLFSTEVKISIIVSILNLISITRLITSNYIEQSRIVSNASNTEAMSNLKAVSPHVHMIKMVIEIFLLILAIIVLRMNEHTEIVNIIMLLSFMIVWLENLMNMLSRLYNATPRPLYTLCEN